MYKCLKYTYANAAVLCSKLLKQIQEVLKYHVSGHENTRIVWITNLIRASSKNFLPS